MMTNYDTITRQVCVNGDWVEYTATYRAGYGWLIKCPGAPNLAVYGDLLHSNVDGTLRAYLAGELRPCPECNGDLEKRDGQWVHDGPCVPTPVKEISKEAAE